MELKPSDLGGGLAVEVIKARVAAAAAALNAGQRGGRLQGAFAPRTDSPKPSRLGILDRILLKGSGLTDDAQKEAATVLSPARARLLAGPVVAATCMLPAIIMLASKGHLGNAGAFGGLAIGMSSLLAGMSFFQGRRHASLPLTEDELANLTVANEGSPLRQDFLRLARAISKQKNISPEVEASLRDALRDLGEALTRLPFSPMKATDASQLRENVARIRAQADAETDPVTQASLSRQADAVERSAEAAERSALITKRTAALHAELAAQIESLRLGLNAFYTGDADVSGLAALSENVRAVAAESVSVASARAELDAVSTYAPAAVTPEPQTITLGR